VAEEMKIDDKRVELQTAPLTLVVPSVSCSTQKTEYLQRVEINVQTAMYHVERTQTFHQRTAHWLAEVFGQDGDYTPEATRQGSTGMQSLAGFFDLSLKLRAMGIPMVLKYPESFLHPGAQVVIADFLAKEIIRPLDT